MKRRNGNKQSPNSDRQLPSAEKISTQLERKSIWDMNMKRREKGTILVTISLELNVIYWRLVLRVAALN
jgi:hypothetical protein